MNRIFCLLLLSLLNPAHAASRAFSIFSNGDGTYMISPVNPEVDDFTKLENLGTNPPPVQEQGVFESAAIRGESRIIGKKFFTLQQAAEELADFLNEGSKLESDKQGSWLEQLKRIPKAFVDHGYESRAKMRSAFHKALQVRQDHLQRLGVEPLPKTDSQKEKFRNDIEGINEKVQEEDRQATKLELLEKMTLNYLSRKADELGLPIETLDRLIGVKNRQVSKFNDSLVVSRKPSFLQWQFDNPLKGYTVFVHKDNTKFKKVRTIRMIVFPKKLAYLMKNATTYKKAFDLDSPSMAYYLAHEMRNNKGKVIKPKRKYPESQSSSIAVSGAKLEGVDVDKPFIIELAGNSDTEIIQNMAFPVAFFDADVLTGLSFEGRNGDTFNFVMELMGGKTESNFLVTNSKKGDITTQLDGKWSYSLKEGEPQISLWVGGRKLLCTFSNQKSGRIDAFETLECRFVDFSGLSMKGDDGEGEYQVESDQVARNRIEEIFKRTYDKASAQVPLEQQLRSVFQRRPDLELEVKQKILDEGSFSEDQMEETKAQVAALKKIIERNNNVESSGYQKYEFTEEEMASITDSIQYDEQVFKLTEVSTAQLVMGNTYTFKSKKVEHSIEFKFDDIYDEDYEAAKNAFEESRGALEAKGRPDGIASLSVLKKRPRLTPESYWYYVSDEPVTGQKRTVTLIGVRSGVEMTLQVRNLGSVLFNEETGDQFYLTSRNLRGLDTTIRYGERAEE